MINIIQELYRRIFKNHITSDIDVIFEKYRFKNRFVEEIIFFRGRKLRVPDVVSFAYQVKEIFGNSIYQFPSNKINPVIFDCGANIGISILYFKQLYPKSKIFAFEADENIFSILKENIQCIYNVELFQNAVWINDDILEFNSEGADGGSLLNCFEKKQKVKAIRLKSILEKCKKIDFLKMDIEGAEIEVLKDCADSLRNIENIFVEYHSFLKDDQELGLILDILKNNGFRYYTETIRKPRRHFMRDKQSSQMDLQVNIFGVRL